MTVASSTKRAKTVNERQQNCRLRKKFGLLRLYLDIDPDEVTDALWRTGCKNIHSDDEDQITSGVQCIVQAACHVVTGVENDLAYAVRNEWSRNSNADEDADE